MKIEEIFVNRENELRKLEEAYAKTMEGKGSIIMLSGRLGTGKTRLIEKFLENKRCFYSECVVGQRPYAPLSSFLSSFFTIERRELDPKLNFLVEGGEEKIEGESLDEVFITLLKFFNSYISTEPLVFVIDNFHDADESTVKFLGFFVKHLELAKIMIICAYRTEMLEEKGRGKVLSDFLKDLIMNDMFNAVIVDNFDEATTGTFLAKAFGEQPPHDCVKILHEKTNGNPLMLIEILRILVEEKKIDLSNPENWKKIEWDKLSIPDSIQEIFQMEIDSLPPEAIAILEYMAVAGNEFEIEIISEAAKQPVSAVQNAANIMVEKGILLQDSETGKYRFSRNIYTELIYKDMGSKILPIGFAIGSAIEKLRKDRLRDYVFDLVRLFGNSRDRRKAYEYAMMAGSAAEKLHSPESVEKYYELAIALADELNLGWEDIYEIRMKEGTGLYFLGAWEKAEYCYLEMLKIAREHEDKKRETESVLALIKLRQYQGEYEKAGEFLQQAIELAKRTADSKFIADALRGIAYMEWRTGEYENAIKHYNEALSYLQSASAEAIFTGKIEAPQENIPIKGEILLELGNVYAEMGEYRQALLFNLKGLKILKETNSPLIARGFIAIGRIHIKEENWQKAIESFKQGIEFAEKINDLDSVGWCYLGLAEAILRSGGNKEEAKKHIEKATHYLSKISDRIGNAMRHKIYADICLQMNELAESEAHIKEAENINLYLRCPYINGEILTAKIEIAISKGEKENAHNYLKQLEEICVKYRMKAFTKFIEMKMKELGHPAPPSPIQQPPEAVPEQPPATGVPVAVPDKTQEGKVVPQLEAESVPQQPPSEISQSSPESQPVAAQERKEKKKRKKKKGGDMQ